MSKRIDHALESREYLEIADEMKGMEEFALSDLAIKQAQAHATLALVEQQRIANVIELHRHEVKNDIGAWSRLYETGGDALKPGIAEALGLS